MLLFLIVQAQSIERQLQLAEAESQRLQEALKAASARTSQQQQELSSSQESLTRATRATEALKQEVAAAAGQAQAARSKLEGLEGQVARLAAVLRQLLLSTGATGSMLEAPRPSGSGPAKVRCFLLSAMALMKSSVS